MPYAACRQRACHLPADKNRFWPDEPASCCFFGLVIATGELIIASLSNHALWF
jgi:hypothetical protein